MAEIRNEVPAYAYAGREDLTEIEIPAGTVRVGRYAFYNCRNLEKLSFHSDICDLGAGALTGCHRVRVLEVTMEPGKPSCLKDFLTELPEEVLVILHGETEARLHFPEYFEESVENTPARILETHTHGSGMMYRNCFLRRVLQFDEYDSRFSAAKALESRKMLIRLAFDRLMYPCQLSEKAAGEYRDYAQEHMEDLCDYLMEEKDVDMLKAFLELFTPGEQLTGDLISRAALEEFPAATAYLMEYRRTHFAKKRRKFTLDF